MRTLIALLAAAITLHLAAALAAASCVEESLADRARRADLVAYGRVSGDRFELRQILKGTANGVITVRFGPTKGAVTSVDYDATDGAEHTLYMRLEGGEYVTDACSGSHAGQPTSDERSFFGVGTGPEVWTQGPIDDSGSRGTAIAIAALAVGAAAVAILRSTRAPRKES